MRTAALGIALAALAVGACATVAGAAEPADIRINGSRVFPESITSDAAGNIYNGSNAGTIYRATAGSATAEPWIVPGAENGLTSVFGVLVHEQSKTLWVCNNPPFGGPPQAAAKSSLKAFDLATGALKKSYEFPDAGVTCNDIAVGPQDTVFATDTSGGRIYALQPNAPALVQFAADPELVGVDGIAFSQAGTMYVNNVRKNTMLRINRTGFNYTNLTALTLSQPINGPDGLRPVSGNRFLQAEGPGNRVTYVDIEGDNAKITPIKTGLDSSPGVTFIGNVGYATEGKIAYLFDASLRDKSPDPFIIRAFTLP